MKSETGIRSASLDSLAAAVGQAQAPRKLLVAEDNPVFQSMLRNLLTRWGYDVIIVPDGIEAWKMLESENAPRLAILDWMMPGIDGVEICRRLRAAPREPYIYVVLLTARTESGDLVEGMDAGADDYLTKPLKPHELRVRLRAGRRIIELQEQLLEAREALRIQATHDSLTGLLNRGSILEALDNEVARSNRESQPLSVLMMDLDRFKQINDTRGHLAGDAVLRESACRMRACIRRYDSAGRYGGEEFLFVLPTCDLNGAWAEADRIRQAMATTPFAVHGELVPVTCSIGVASRGWNGAEDTSSLLREADLGLYLAKDRGRNRVAVSGMESPDTPEQPLAASACPV
jgi:two-component system, cell cycle response regulator